MITIFCLGCVCGMVVNYLLHMFIVKEHTFGSLWNVWREKISKWLK